MLSEKTANMATTKIIQCRGQSQTSVPSKAKITCHSVMFKMNSSIFRPGSHV